MLAVHDKIDELLAHLDILSFYPEPHKIIIVASGPALPPEIQFPVYRSDAIQNGMGPPLAWVEGLRHVQTEWSVYRNADDWVCDHQHTIDTVKTMEREGKDCGGYCWFGAGHWDNVTMNELYLRQSVLQGVSLDQWRDFFRLQRPNICEAPVAQKLFGLIPEHKRYRVPGREHPHSIGERYERRADNCRWHCKNWLMFSDHDMPHKRNTYRAWRDLIPYAAELEQKPNFKRWLEVDK